MNNVKYSRVYERLVKAVNSFHFNRNYYGEPRSNLRRFLQHSLSMRLRCNRFPFALHEKISAKIQ